jgi:hypothetical protein
MYIISAQVDLRANINPVSLADWEVSAADV